MSLLLRTCPHDAVLFYNAFLVMAQEAINTRMRQSLLPRFVWTLVQADAFLRGLPEWTRVVLEPSAISFNNMFLALAESIVFARSRICLGATLFGRWPSAVQSSEGSVTGSLVLASCWRLVSSQIPEWQQLSNFASPLTYPL